VLAGRAHGCPNPIFSASNHDRDPRQGEIHRRERPKRFSVTDTSTAERMAPYSDQLSKAETDTALVGQLGTSAIYPGLHPGQRFKLMPRSGLASAGLSPRTGPR